MNFVISIDSLLCYDSVHYTGENHYVEILKNKYSFIKGYLFFTPRMFEHSLYSLNTSEQSGLYFLRELTTGKIYIGSSGNIYKRIMKHKFLINNKRHDNKNFNDLLKNTNIKNFELIVIFTDNREEAYKLEQYFVDFYKETNCLLNIANDVKVAMKGLSLSEDHKKKLLEVNKGRTISEKHKQILSEFQKNNEAAIFNRQKFLSSKKRKISVLGVEYESLTEAGIKSGLSESFIRKKVNDNTYKDIFWLSNNQSPLKGRNLSSDFKQKLSEFRKNDPKSIAQLQSIQLLKRKSIILNGVHYPSVSDAVKYSGYSSYRIFQELKHVDRNKPYILNIV